MKRSYIVIVNLKIGMDGYICFVGTVFAYGVTSSGKTHTMHVSAELLWFLVLVILCSMCNSITHSLCLLSDY